ncbi:MAG: glycosyltransferase family 4 protein [Gemmatimonadota bacterium]|nr:glycosyltransferase family 4 protein [Gemmatimonadota bacterium]
MNLVLIFGLLLAVFLSAQWITGRFCRSGAAQKILDIPNARSSHAVATPRGGGMAIVLTTLPALVILGSVGATTSALVSGLLGGGALVALIGFADDHAHIAPRWRLLGHFIAALWVVTWLRGLPSLPMLGFAVELGWIGYVLAVIYLVWVLNLTNFMDGIDAIAGVEVITVSVGGAILYLVTVPSGTQWLAPLVLASATLGFLMWNWPPAKIFMGDGGSGFLGLMLAALSLQAAWVEPKLFWSWIILLGVFVVDATVTLVLRVTRGEKFYEAHRSHAYQHAAEKTGAHLPVVLAVGAINLGWLLPCATLVALGSLDGIAGVVIAYAPLVAAALWLRAGRPVVK